MTLYLIFCLATAFTACIVMLYPAIERVKLEDPNNIMLRHVLATYIIIIIMMVILAPIIFILGSRVSSTEHFSVGLSNALLK